ncbi:hypothetical protein GC177_08870 [bacterium]|nr:hypothetical protein [bacterium]
MGCSLTFAEKHLLKDHKAVVEVHAHDKRGTAFYAFLLCDGDGLLKLREMEGRDDFFPLWEAGDVIIQGFGDQVPGPVNDFIRAEYPPA